MLIDQAAPQTLTKLTVFARCDWCRAEGQRVELTTVGDAVREEHIAAKDEARRLAEGAGWVFHEKGEKCLCPECRDKVAPKEGDR